MHLTSAVERPTGSRTNFRISDETMPTDERRLESSAATN